MTDSGTTDSGMTDSGMTDSGTPEVRKRPRYGRVSTVVAALFGLIYAYDLFEAISNVVGVVTQLDAYNVFAAENGLDQASVPWILLVATLALPPVAYGVAMVLGRRHGLGMRALLFAAGLAVVAAATLSLTALA